MELRKDFIREFLAKNNLRVSGTKEEIRERMHLALEEGTVSYPSIIEFLDVHVPWGKQHVLLYKGSEGLSRKWRDEKKVDGFLKSSRVHKYKNAKLPLILPEKLTLSSIFYLKNEEVRFLAVEKRLSFERREDWDEYKQDGGEFRYLKAFEQVFARGIIMFRWNLVSNTAELHMSQLPSHWQYEAAEERFATLIGSVIDLSLFEKLDIKKAIKKLYTNEAHGIKEITSHSLSFRTLGNRTVSAQSPAASTSVLGEPDVDAALVGVSKKSVGYVGNFYWQPNTVYNKNGNPLLNRIHTILVGSKNRINFTTPNNEDTMNYVLSRVRELCK